VIRILIVTFLYFALAKIGLWLSIGDTNVSPVWPSAGVALASMLLFGSRIWPGIWLGAFLANYFGGLSPITSLGISIGNMLEACFGFYLVKNCTAVSASIGTASLFLTPSTGGANLAEAILEKRPNTKILFMSGYSEESVLRRNPSAAFLQKPFSLGTFLERINEFLDHPDRTL
jgi:MASE1